MSPHTWKRGSHQTLRWILMRLSDDEYVPVINWAGSPNSLPAVLADQGRANRLRPREKVQSSGPLDHQISPPSMTTLSWFYYEYGKRPPLDNHSLRPLLDNTIMSPLLDNGIIKPTLDNGIMKPQQGNRILRPPLDNHIRMLPLNNLIMRPPIYWLGFLTDN